MEKISQQDETNVTQNDHKKFEDNEIKRVCSADTNSVKTLNLANNTTITSSSLVHFSGTKWSNLTFLNLYNNTFEGKGCKYITNARMRNLTVLDIGKIEIKKGSIKQALLESFIYPKGSGIDFKKYILKGCNKIKYDGMFWLSKSEWGYNLEILTYFRNEMPQEQLELILLTQLKHIKSIKLDENLKDSTQKSKFKYKIGLKYCQQQILV